MNRFPLRHLSHAAYVAISLGFIRRIIKKTRLAYSRPDNVCPRAVYPSDKVVPPLPRGVLPEEIMIVDEYKGNRRYVAGMRYSGRVWWFFDGGMFIECYVRTENGYCRKETGKPLESDVELLPVDPSYPYAMNACVTVMMFHRHGVLPAKP